MTDDQARIQLDRRLALVNSPVPPDQAADRSLVYAPVGLCALAIVFNVERQVHGDALPADLALNGLRFTSMKLNPRLVAKLLTQSYRFSVAVPVEAMKQNPLGLFDDPEFFALNPEYKGFVDSETVPDALVQLNGADVTSLLWGWVIADPDTKGFLNGAPDQFGMRINPANQGLALPTSTVPRNDPSCSEHRDDSGSGGQPVISTGVNAGGGVPSTAPGGVTVSGGGVLVSTPGPVQQPVASRQRTPSLLAPAVGGLFLAVLICIAVAIVNPPVLGLLRTSSPVRYLLGVLARVRARRGVRPTER